MTESKTQADAGAERPILSDPQAPDVLSRLDQEVTEEAKAQRTHERMQLRARIQLQPGNMSQRADFKVNGVLGDLSDGGFQGLFPRPMNVGDFYYVQFDRSKIDLPGMLAMCKRCRQVRHDAYESGFAFFAAVDAVSAIGQKDGDDEGAALDEAA